MGNTDNIAHILADCETILRSSSHIYYGNQNDCNELSKYFGYHVVSCRNFAANSPLLSGSVSIVEGTFTDGRQAVVVSSGGRPVFKYGKESRYSVPVKYEVLSNDYRWQADIATLEMALERGAL